MGVPPKSTVVRILALDRAFVASMDLIYCRQYKAPPGVPQNAPTPKSSTLDSTTVNKIIKVWLLPVLTVGRRTVKARDGNSKPQAGRV